MTREDAEQVALAALLFVTADAGRLTRFLAATGLDPGTLRARAAEPDMLAAVLGHLLEDESLLLVFAAEAARSPESVARAEALMTASALGGQGE